MANTQEQNKKIKNLVKFLLAVMVLILIWAFFNDSTYNVVKRQFVKNADKYIEMYAYIKSKPAFNEKYFIVQNNKQAESFLRKEAKAVEEKNIDSISCSKDETILLYEKPSQKISEYIQKKGGEELMLNKGTDIEFYAAKVKGSTESCNVGGE